ncbi:PH domain-containing protein [Metabacillus fastidiosus]|uniref:PH domain-containing protein n=1 Tax=Metabacillus fastidiosus TaxID=1458 RepID=UPI003D26C4EB
MSFRSRKDTTYLGIIGFIILIAFSGLIMPIFIGASRDSVVRVLIFIITIVFLLWFIFSMKYTLLDDHLLVKSAFLRKRIPYKDITGIRRINSIGEMLTGYQLLTSKKGLEISYKTGMIGNVKISPDKEEEFLTNLQKNCSNLSIK